MSCAGSARPLSARSLLAPKPPPPQVDALLVSALALLWPSGAAPPYAEHTLVDQAVTAARRRTPAASNFVNAVLRRFVRERDAIVPAAMHDPQGAFNHPPWWIERVRRDWPLAWQALLAANQQHPPMTLRVNARRGGAAAYVARLAAYGIAAEALGAHAVRLAAPRPVRELPGFDDGEVSVQDAAAQRAAPLLLGAGLPPGARVLDACAAPGGKTAHLLELADIDLLALDADPLRLQRVQQTLNRLVAAAPGSWPATRVTPRHGGTAGRSMRSCSTRRAAARGSCVAIPTSAGCAGPATSAPSRRRKASCSTLSGRC